MKTTKCGSVFNKKPEVKEVPAVPVKKAKKRAKKKEQVDAVHVDINVINDSKDEEEGK